MIMLFTRIMITIYYDLKISALERILLLLLFFVFFLQMGTDHQSMQSVAGKVSCNNTAL